MQSSLTLRVRYRPVRIGWCVRGHNWDDFRLVARTNQILWGGKFNPIIPIDSPHADKLIAKFRVDVLLSAANDDTINAFIERFSYLPWPLFDKPVFTNSPVGRVINFVDVYRPLTIIADQVRLHESSDSVDDGFIGSPESNRYALVKWHDGDPLSDVFLSTFGEYPAHPVPGESYERFLQDNIKPFQYRLLQSETIPGSILRHFFISDITGTDLNWDRVPSDEKMGFYVGSANDFVDVINYWNLRASDLNVLFLDPTHISRLIQIKDEHSEFIAQRRTSTGHLENVIPVWSRSQELVKALAFPPQLVAYYTHVTDNGVINANLHPPLHYWTHKSVLASVASQYGTVAASFQLPEKPFKVGTDWSTEHFVVSIDAPIDRDAEATLWTPYIPELNQWYGRKIHLDSKVARVAGDGIGFITNITDENLTIYGILKQELVTELFGMAKLEVEPSLPGRVASRLIKQLGGLVGCRVLKITGVRNLIKKYGPLEEFDRSEALRILGNCDPETGRPRFSDFEELSFEFRPLGAKKLKPENVFLFLLEKGVFRIGLTLICPICELSFWMQLDELQTEVKCEVCGGLFNISRQLKDRSWKYRRSGLFGRENNQEGSIPVALTIEYLQALLGTGFSRSFFLTNLSLHSATGHVRPCETDFFAAISAARTTQIAIGECKDSGGAITLDDAEKMAAIADSFPRSRFEVYIVFSKTAAFTEEEIQYSRLAQPQGGGLRVILLSSRELESDPLFPKSSSTPGIRIAHSLHEMARLTHELYFSSKRTE